MKKLICWSMTIVLLVISSGCAAILKSSHEHVSLNSDPEDAEVFINGEYYGHTPVRIELRSSQDYLIEFRKPGFQTVTRTIRNHIGTGWVILDVICGLVPVLVDALTGSWCDLDQDHVNVLLRRQQPHP